MSIRGWTSSCLAFSLLQFHCTILVIRCMDCFLERFYFYYLLLILLALFLFIFFSLFLLSACHSRLDRTFFLPGEQCISYPLPFILISWSVVLFWKLSMSVYSMPFRCLYLGSPWMFVSIRELHFSHSLWFILLQQCSISLCLSLNCWSSWNIFLCISRHYYFQIFYF